MVSEVSVSAVAAMRARPGFAAAMREHARGVVALFRGNSLLNLLMNDRARALFMVVALYLHHHGRGDGKPGLTVGALKELCVRLDLCSRGRCEAMLAVLRAAGYLAPAASDDKRRRVLVPTDRLVALQTERWRAHFDAIEIVVPEVARYRALLGRPDFVAAFIGALGEPYIAGFRMLHHAPRLFPFVERNGGVAVLFALALEGAEEGPFPPTQPVRLSINALSTQFGVSRKHVLTLLRDLEAEGLMRRGPEPDRVTFLPPLRDGLETMTATIFVYFIQAGTRAAAAIETAELATDEPAR
ncbi:hypothetical protein [Rhodoplanes azumiensis]|uniref:MarR family transcriptional regulator n=1 Tax=Rhodoplanes azumiensis TaxID=1897628 RepID=A0ABW5ADW6_9BRAD